MDTDVSITSNITRVIIRRIMKCLLNQSVHSMNCATVLHSKKNLSGFNIKSTGFTLADQSGSSILYGCIQMRLVTWASYLLSKTIIGEQMKLQSLIKSAGTVDYKKGEIIVNTFQL